MKTASSNTSEAAQGSHNQGAYQHDSRGMKWLAIISALIAAGIHSYLLKSHYDLHYGEVSGKLMCDVSSKFSCSAASASRFSEFLGVPMALWGLLANAAFLTLAAWDPLTEGEGRRSNRTGLFITAGVILMASIVMGLITLTSLDSVCLFCAGTYGLSILTALGTWFGYKQNFKLTLKPALLGVFFAFAVSAFILNDQFRSGYTGPGGDAMATAAVQEWSQNPKLTINETDPLAMGPSRADAKLTMIEFADFRCIHCKLASAPIKAFVSSHSDVRLEFYSWPLDGECNTSIQTTNGASCLLARTVWCARHKGGKGWEAHEKVFERFEEWKTAEAVRANLDGLATQLGLPAEELKTCADSDDAKKAITAQAQLGSALNIRGTPAIYVNGQLLPAGSSLPVLNAVYSSVR